MEEKQSSKKEEIKKLKEQFERKCSFISQHYKQGSPEFESKMSKISEEHRRRLFDIEEEYPEFMLDDMSIIPFVASAVLLGYLVSKFM